MRTIETDRFGCSEGERAAFEAGIKLGSLFHQFIGTPVRPESRGDLERAMTSALLCQPHVIGAEVRIDEDVLKSSLNEFGYSSLDGKMIEARVEVVVGEAICTGRLKWIEELGYPLMWVESVDLCESLSGKILERP
jgi:hypothetical protein